MQWFDSLRVLSCKWWQQDDAVIHWEDWGRLIRMILYSTPKKIAEGFRRLLMFSNIFYDSPLFTMFYHSQKKANSFFSIEIGPHSSFCFSCLRLNFVPHHPPVFYMLDENGKETETMLAKQREKHPEVGWFMWEESEIWRTGISEHPSTQSYIFLCGVVVEICFF